jgi:hypothetical protein
MTSMEILVENRDGLQLKINTLNEVEESPKVEDLKGKFVVHMWIILFFMSCLTGDDESAKTAMSNILVYFVEHKYDSEETQQKVLRELTDNKDLLASVMGVCTILMDTDLFEEWSKQFLEDFHSYCPHTDKSGNVVESPQYAAHAYDTLLIHQFVGMILGVQKAIEKDLTPEWQQYVGFLCINHDLMKMYTFNGRGWPSHCSMGALAIEYFTKSLSKHFSDVQILLLQIIYACHMLFLLPETDDINDVLMWMIPQDLKSEGKDKDKDISSQTILSIVESQCTCDSCAKLSHSSLQKRVENPEAHVDELLTKLGNGKIQRPVDIIQNIIIEQPDSKYKSETSSSMDLIEKRASLSDTVYLRDDSSEFTREKVQQWNDDGKLVVIVTNAALSNSILFKSKMPERFEHRSVRVMELTTITPQTTLVEALREYLAAPGNLHQSIPHKPNGGSQLPPFTETMLKHYLGKIIECGSL